VFGHRYFGARYYGPRYFGDGGIAAAALQQVVTGGGGRRRRRRYPYPNVIDDGWDWDAPDARAEPAAEPAAPLQRRPAPSKAPEPASEPSKPVGLGQAAMREPVAASALPRMAQVPPDTEQRIAALEARIEALEAREAPDDDEDEERLIMRWFLDS
jgi:hypothetical protein